MTEEYVKWLEEYTKLVRSLHDHIAKRPLKVKAKVKDPVEKPKETTYEDIPDIWKKTDWYPKDGKRIPWGIPYTPLKWSGCYTCGMKMDGAMGYVCPRPDCPSKVTFQSYNDSSGG